MFEKPFSFEGRIRRSEFGISFIIYVILATLLSAFGEAGGEAGAVINLLGLIPLLWFLWAQGAKRCHDVGNSGWFQIIPFYIFWMLFQDGEIGPNKYGENPKGKTYSHGYSNQPSNGSPVPPPVPGNGGSYSGGYDGGHNNHGTAQPNFSQSSTPSPSQSGEYKNGDLYN